LGTVEEDEAAATGLVDCGVLACDDTAMEVETWVDEEGDEEETSCVL